MWGTANKNWNYLSFICLIIGLSELIKLEENVDLVAKQKRFVKNLDSSLVLKTLISVATSICHVLLFDTDN